MSRLYPQRVEHGFQQLGGKPVEEFVPNPVLLFLSVAGGFVMLAAGVVVVLYGLRNLDEDMLELWWLPLVLLGVGGFLAWRGWHLWGQHLMVCPRGLLLKQGLEVSILRWEDIKRIEKTAGSMAYEIVRKKGESWHLDSLHTPRIARLEELLRAEAKSRKIPWTEKKKDEE